MPAYDVLVTATFKEKAADKRYLTVTKEWTVFCSPETFAVPEGMKAYTISAVTQPTTDGGNGTITLKQQTIIGEGVPMVLENTVVATTTQFEIINTTGTIDAADQCSEFKGSATAATTLSSNNTNYVLKNGNFVRTTATKVSKHSCYLEFTTPVNAQSFELIIEDINITSVNEVRSKTEEVRGEYFNLAGQRVTQPTRGLYIVNGKKIMIK